MKKVISLMMTNTMVLSVLSLCVLTMSTFGANTRCAAIFHDVEKPKALDSLKKY